MIKIVVITHGNFGQELISSAEMIVGKQEELVAISIGASDRLIDLEQALEKIMGNSAGKDFLILTDMAGGSTCHVCLPFCQSPNVAVVSGVNLYMLLSALNNRSHRPLAELAEKVIGDGKRSIEDIKSRFCNYLKK